MSPFLECIWISQQLSNSWEHQPYLYMVLSDLITHIISFTQRHPQIPSFCSSRVEQLHDTKSAQVPSKVWMLLCQFLLLKSLFAAFGVNITRLRIDLSWHTIIYMVETTASPVAQFWLHSTATSSTWEQPGPGIGHPGHHTLQYRCELLAQRRKIKIERLKNRDKIVQTNFVHILQGTRSSSFIHHQDLCLILISRGL